MRIPRGAISPEVRVLLKDLERRGYSVAEKRYDKKSFGDVIIVLERDATRVRLCRDRGQWFIDVNAADDWFDPEIWRAFLEGKTPPVEIVVPFAEQAHWLLENLGRIEVNDLTKKQRAAMDGLRSSRFAARMELPPDRL